MHQLLEKKETMFVYNTSMMRGGEKLQKNKKNDLYIGETTDRAIDD